MELKSRIKEADAVNDNEYWIKSSTFSLRAKDKNDIQNKQLLNARVVDAAQLILKQLFHGFQSSVCKKNLKHFKKIDNFTSWRQQIRALVYCLHCWLQ